jgi:hypothetical protein
VASRRAAKTAIVGVSDHGGWAVLVTVRRDAALVDRRRVELVEKHLPSLPHHHDAQGLPENEALALVERVRSSASTMATAALEALSGALPMEIAGIALRTCPPLPATVAERLRSYRAQNVADWVMYRQALAGAAEARSWWVHWYDAKSVFAEAARAVGRRSIDGILNQTGASVGPPWQKDHKLAMAAAIAATAVKR